MQQQKESYLSNKDKLLYLVYTRLVFAFKPMYSQDTWVYYILNLCHISKEFIPFLFKGIHFIVNFDMYCSFKNFIFKYPSNPIILSFLVPNLLL